MTKKIYISSKLRTYYLVGSLIFLGAAIYTGHDTANLVSVLGILTITFSTFMFLSSLAMLLGCVLLSVKSRFVIYDDHIVISASFYRNFDFRFTDKAVTFHVYPRSIIFFVNNRKVHTFLFFGLSKESVMEIESVVRSQFNPSAL